VSLSFKDGVIINKKTHEQFLIEFNNKYPDFEVMEEYITSKTPILFKHLKCNNLPFKISPEKFRGCPICNRIETLKGTPEEKLKKFKKEVYNLVGNDYSVLGFNNKTKKYIIRHENKNCNYYQYEIKRDGFILGKRCLICSGKNKKTIEQIKKEIFNLVGNEYKLLDKYKNTNTL